MFLLVPLLALIGTDAIHGKVINSLIGPYITYGERFYTCEPVNPTLPWKWYIRHSHFNPRKPKELQRLTGNVTGSTYSYDDSCWGKAVVDVRSNNQWKENAFVFDFKNNPCRAFRENMPGIFNFLYKQGGVEGTCKFKPEIYLLNDTPMDWTFPNIPVLPYGHYRVRVSAGKAEIVFCCLAADVRVIPKLE
ncbi:uncharacterized protein LOC113212946 [Frankliniella occidentalis]|uniref:Uncharacterized protein LOC113212946 n=1 Tax=Frankliniella occidentalis TaxID=133901 RepID=A0A6J1T7F6_FRAOC|nr:uncharacterized protein LOC113212946 [Frankliniella occidentalis]